uniref:Thymidylate kinase-like domain-containing protein n=1 Tax=Timema monikensis TaxID=170555 RepID=A0A7R9HL39_9NEOP|nr:unnamed protein product [Timema monikensis]
MPDEVRNDTAVCETLRLKILVRNLKADATTEVMAAGRNTGSDQIKSVYHSCDSVFEFLKHPKYYNLNEVQELISIYETQIENNKSKLNLTVSEDVKKHPVIVLEGLDGSGKTTLSKKLSSKLNAKKMSTPPSCLLTLREKFDTHPIALRRAYYALGNYIAAAEIEYLCHHTPVIVDRFWHSTAAYTIASEVGESMVLPPEGDPIYNWPIDLLRPDMVVFLSVGEYNRVARHTGRNTTNTPEERTLQDNSTFRNNRVKRNNPFSSRDSHYLFVQWQQCKV